MAALLAHALAAGSVDGETQRPEMTVTVSCALAPDESLSIDRITGYRHDEGYRLRASRDEVSLSAPSRRGIRNGVATLLQLSRAWPSESFEIVDSPCFPVRGFIEGYYGPPWKNEDRLRVMRRLAGWKMNTYMYAPKDDRYHRSLWREPYPPAEQAALQRLITSAGELELDFWYAIGPGLSMEYSSEEDFHALASKLARIAGLGVRRFGLLFDDIPAAIQHESDRNAFRTLAQAHATTANRLYASLAEATERPGLVVCPTVYHGHGTEPYVQELGLLLDPRIDFFWTGPEICSRELSLRDTATVERVTNRPVIFWDNYPVNDLEMQNELHLGPYRGRDPHLFRAACGLVANASENPEASQIPLLTIADYLWNPIVYEPEASWGHALEVVVGAEDVEAFREFADCNRFSALYPTDAPALAAELEQCMFRLELGDLQGAAQVLRDAVSRLDRADALFTRGMRNRQLESEIAPWREKYRLGVALLRSAIPLVSGGTVHGESPGSSFSDAARAFRANPRYVFADVLHGLLERFDGDA